MKCETWWTCCNMMKHAENDEQLWNDKTQWNISNNVMSNDENKHKMKMYEHEWWANNERYGKWWSEESSVIQKHEDHDLKHMECM